MTQAPGETRATQLDDRVLESIRREIDDNPRTPGRRTIRRLLDHITYLDQKIESIYQDAAGEDI